MMVIVIPAMTPLIVPAHDQSENEFRFADGRDQIAFVEAAGFVVNENDAAADHGHDENGDGDRAGEQIFDVLDVGIDFHDGR